MFLHVLGPLRATVDARPVPLGGRRARTVLAALALEPDWAVSVESLVEAVWGPHSPASARTQIRICVSALRRAFASAGAPEVIETLSYGYRLRIGPDQLDSAVFESRVHRARELAEHGRQAEAVLELRSALALWTGPAFAGENGPALEPGVLRLEELRMRATEEKLRLELALGRHSDVIGELMALTAAHPFREQLHGQLMLALHRAGRTAEALAAYRRIRLTLVDELGIEPGPGLSGLERSILLGERLEPLSA
ncbi:AfsR/SARP family transcriptional regulator [Streptomyces sp. NPDC000963]|uniref:AfsR/SARP family transcriptional regulator n=1 Tax=unclassified Streptomyces TaxID=2593676 RepID=UPI000F7ABCC8|nr:BTAD domain-containing putative transcriptional regulator [Streptomyces sp. WAC08241]MYV70632.1 transcriptional regulator [Streptomyces sp. SID2131]RSS33054.1 transcriptional regulator [Streptomyces sp. WAC08241]